MEKKIKYSRRLIVAFVGVILCFLTVFGIAFAGNAWIN